MTKSKIGKGLRWLTSRFRPNAETVFGIPRRVTPVSRTWGYDRGRPVDRYYVEAFLERHKADIRGRVLEVGDDSYTLRFGGDRVTTADVLNPEPGGLTTVVGDLGRDGQLPEGRFDCIILTQTLHLIYDTRAALRNLSRALKPGGVLLATFPGISPISLTEWPGQWYWNFTSNSAKRLFGDVFPDGAVEIQSAGNVLVCSAFLYGLADHELRPEELDAHDPAYELVLLTRAVRQ